MGVQLSYIVQNIEIYSIIYLVINVGLNNNTVIYKTNDLLFLHFNEIMSCIALLLSWKLKFRLQTESLIVHAWPHYLASSTDILYDSQLRHRIMMEGKFKMNYFVVYLPPLKLNNYYLLQVLISYSIKE